MSEEVGKIRRSLLVKSMQPLCDCGRILDKDQIKSGVCEMCLSKDGRCMHGNKKPCRLCEADT